MISHATESIINLNHLLVETCSCLFSVDVHPVAVQEKVGSRQMTVTAQPPVPHVNLAWPPEGSRVLDGGALAIERLEKRQAGSSAPHRMETP